VCRVTPLEALIAALVSVAVITIFAVVWIALEALRFGPLAKDPDK